MTSIKYLVRPERNRHKTMALALCLLFLGTPRFYAQGTGVPTEYQVKAAFLFNFTQFVEWPPSAFSDPSAPFVIGVIGQDPFGNYLDQIVANEKVAGHNLKVMRYQEGKEIRNCQVLFISSYDSDRTRSILAQVSDRSILTVGETYNFIDLGGMVRFFIKDSRIRFQINQNAAKAVQLVVSSKLLRVAETNR